MPKLEPKIIQRELDQGLVWPVYWVYGPERMKVQELLKRIRKAVLGAESVDGAGADSSLAQFSEERLDGTETDGMSVVDCAKSPSLLGGGGTKLVVVREAHALKETEALAELLGPRAKREELGSVTVFLSKDLDGRKKFSKTLVEKAAVVQCEEVPEADREAWIGYLAKRKGITVIPELVVRLIGLDPWSLDLIDQELDKYSIALLGSDQSGDGVAAAEVVLHNLIPNGGSEAFLHAFFTRDLKTALSWVETFASQPDEALPLLGLFSWNVRQLALLGGGSKPNPYLAERLREWSRFWSRDELIRLQARLQELDHGLKQTSRLPLGLWDSLVLDTLPSTHSAL